MTSVCVNEKTWPTCSDPLTVGGGVSIEKTSARGRVRSNRYTPASSHRGIHLASRPSRAGFSGRRRRAGSAALDRPGGMVAACARGWLASIRDAGAVRSKSGFADAYDSGKSAGAAPGFEPNQSIELATGLAAADFPGDAASPLDRFAN